MKGEIHLPKWLSPGAKNLIRRILDPNPKSRITMASIKMDDWFRKDYHPVYLEDEEDTHMTNEALSFSMHEVVSNSNSLLFFFFFIITNINYLKETVTL